MTSKYNKGFQEGIWYAVEQLVLEHDEPQMALDIVKESGIPKQNFVNILGKTKYGTKELKEEVLDKWNFNHNPTTK